MVGKMKLVEETEVPPAIMYFVSETVSALEFEFGKRVFDIFRLHK